MECCGKNGCAWGCLGCGRGVYNEFGERGVAIVGVGVGLGVRYSLVTWKYVRLTPHPFYSNALSRLALFLDRLSFPVSVSFSLFFFFFYLACFSWLRSVSFVGLVE